MRTASALRWPWQAIGSEPPLVSIRTFESSTPVSMFTEATCAIWMVCSCLPNQRGLYWTTLVDVMATCVGNRWLPRLRRLARNTSPVVNGRLFDQAQYPNTTTIAKRAAAVHQSHAYSPLINADVKLFPS